MKRNLKITIAALAAILLMAIAATVVTFSLADNEGEDDIITDADLLASAEGGETLTNIDYIIRNSNDEESSDQIYHVVEIGSSATPSTLKQMVESEAFKEYVINGNKTIDDVMTDGKVDYVYYYAPDVTNDNTDALATIAKADFIYVSNDEASPYQVGRDIGEDLYNLLHTYAVGDYNPLIIDSPTNFGTPDDPSAIKTFKALIQNYYATRIAYGTYYTFYWDQTMSTTQFFKGATGTNSFYIGINGRTAQKNWTDFTGPDGVTRKMSEVLVISNSGDTFTTNSSSLANKVFADCTRVQAAEDEVATGTDPEEENGNATGDEDIIFDITGSAFYEYGYNQRYAQYRPNYSRVTEVSLADMETAVDTFDMDKYDLIIFEDDCITANLSDELFNKFVSAMYANNHIIFNEALGTATENDQDTTGNLDNYNETNYSELFYMVATESEIARYQNIMITNRNDFAIYATSNSAATCKTIADLINSSAFRGIGGPGSSSSMFTVLEIQPCYPIDTTIAQAKNSYYDQPSEVVNGKTQEQIGDTETEYYDWELSEAKIADAFNMEATQVKVVHMSAEEFAANKSDVLGNYDLVYIGGNTTARKDAKDYASVVNLMGWGQTVSQAGVSVDNMTYLPIYSMYSHNGDIIKLTFPVLGSSGWKVETGKLLFGKSALDTTGNSTFTTLNGNDFTYNNYLNLKEYVDAGMPVVFSDEVTAAYNLAAGLSNSYLQNSIDPDSNVYKFLSYCSSKTADGELSILWNFNDSATELVDNDGGRLGVTLTGSVEVFQADEDSNSISKTSLYSTYLSSTKRPKLAVTSKPVQYNLYNEDTKLTSRDMEFKYSILGSENYTVNLYIDDDNNTIFSSDELFQKSTTSSLTYSLGSFKGGPVYWKLEVVAHDNNDSVVSTTGTAYFKPQDDEKSNVNILQILPGGGLSGAQGVDSLFFCTECQKNYTRLTYNGKTKNMKYNSDNAMYSGADSSFGIGTYTEYDANGYSTAGDSVYMGKHQHTFGVVKYDSNLPITDDHGNPTSVLGRDDWDYNLADELEDLYNFDIDILTDTEFDAIGADITDYFTNTTFTVSMTDDEGTTTTVSKKYADMTTEEKAALVDQLQGKESDAYNAYIDWVDEDVAEAEEALRDCIKNMISNAPQYADELQRLLDTGYYNDFFNGVIQDTYSHAFSTAYCTGTYLDNGGYEYYYNNYVIAVDKKLALKEAYQKAAYYAAYAAGENWLKAVYDTIIIGPAENFNNEDLYDENCLITLREYVEDDGSLLLFHETLSRYADAGSSNLTTYLRSAFGTDESHMEADTSLVGEDKKLTYDKVTMFGQNIQAQIKVYSADGSTDKSVALNNISPDSENVKVSLYNEEYKQLYSSKNDWTVTSQTTDGTLDGQGTITITVDISGVYKEDVPNPSQPWIVDHTTEAQTDFEGRKVELVIGNYNWVSDGYGSSVYEGTVSGGKVTFQIANYKTDTITTTYKASDVYYVPYKVDATTAEKVQNAEDKYFLTNLSYLPKNDTTRYYTWREDMKNAFANFSAAYYYAPPMYSDAQFYADTATNTLASPYIYSQNGNGGLDWGIATKWATGTGDNAGTNKASQNNSGIITTYPFTLSASLNITGTHPSAYAADIDSSDMTVWYTLAGGSVGKSGSSLYAATPNDGRDNYFIYSYGNVFYCGAGHTKVTGKGKDNNDERMLYINIICNSVRNSVRQPSIDVYDYGTTKNEIIIKKDGSYLYEVDEGTEYPAFTFRATVDPDAEIKSVNIYYKLDPDGGNVYNENTDKYIIKMTGTDVKSEQLVDIGSKVEMLKLEDSYMTPYGGNYTYIVIEVTDTNGAVSYQKIKITRKAHLFDLT